MLPQVFTISPFWGHSPSVFHPVGYYLGHENFACLQKFLDETGWNQEIAGGVTVQVRGASTTVKFFITGDHQLHVRMGAARSPNAHVHRCQYCDTPGQVCPSLLWQDMVSWKCGILECKAVPLPSALLPCVPPLQRPPDILHGTAVATAALHTFTTLLLDVGKKQAKRMVFDEDSCSSKLTQWQKYVTDEKFRDLPFDKSEDGEHLRLLWDQHYLLVTSLLECGGTAPDAASLETACTEVCLVPH